MSKPRNVKVSVIAVAIDCPHCGEPMAGDGGSLGWDVNFLDGGVVQCYSCQKPSTLPESVKASTKFPRMADAKTARHRPTT